MEGNKVKIRIDGTDFTVEPKKNLLHTCLSLGFDIPYFCYHPAFGSVGACRQCAVLKYANPDDKKGKIVMSCMEPVVEGLIISTDDPSVKEFRAAIIESLMTNHPHDCPVCDEGGECHLQDMTVMTGHAYRRFGFKKRTYKNQYLGPYIQHEMNRCIQCYRCVRFYKGYAGGKDLDVFGSSNRIYFGRYKEGKLESDFSGNLIEVCPTGVFTDKILREHYTRKWDLTNAPSVCRNCSLGCNIIVSERYGSVRRILSRYNGAVNGYFICDRGRFGFEYVNGPERVRKVMARMPGKEIHEAVNKIDLFPSIKALIKGKKLAGIGSPSASLESNFALERLVGRENFYHGISEEEFKLTKTAITILKEGTAHSASLKEIESSDAVLILGENIPETAPMLALAVRQASRNRAIDLAGSAGIPYWNDSAVRDLAQKIKSPVFIATQEVTKLDELTEKKYIGDPADIAGLGKAVASLIENNPTSLRGQDKDFTETARQIAVALVEAKNPVIITGFQCNNMEVIHSASAIAGAIAKNGGKPNLSIVFPESNSLGLGMMEGRSLASLKDAVNRGDIDTLIIMENDLFKRDDRKSIELILSKVSGIIVLSQVMDETAARADLLLPSGTFAESTGTVVNNEGRAQRSYRVLPEDGVVKDSWKYLSEMIDISSESDKKGWRNFDELVASFTDLYPVFKNIREIMPDSDFRIWNEKIARQTMRFSGRTAMNAGVKVSEPGPPDDYDSPLNFSMEGYKGVPSSGLVTYYWSPGWNSVQAMNKYMDEPGGIAEGGNPGVLLFNK